MAISYVEQDGNHVAICYNVGLSFLAQLPAFSSFGQRFALDQIIVCHNLGSNKTALQVCVDLSSGLSCYRAIGNSPRPHFVFAHGEECA